MQRLPYVILVSILLLISGSLVTAQDGILDYGLSISGTLTETTETIGYQFSGSAGDYITIQAMAVTPALDTTLELLSADGTTLVTNDNGLNVFGSLDAELSVLLPDDGVYEIVVGRNGSVGDETFVLRLNGTQAEAITVTGNAPVLASINPDAPFAVYDLVAGSVTIANETPLFMYTVEVFNPITGESIARINGGRLPVTTISLPNPSTPYTLVIYSTDFTTDGEIMLSIDDSDVILVEEPIATRIPGSLPDTGCEILTQGNGTNVRTGPGRDYSVIVALPPNATAPIHGTYETWYQISLEDGQVGWVSNTVVQRLGTCDNLPPALPPSADPPTPADTATATVTPTITATVTQTATATPTATVTSTVAESTEPASTATATATATLTRTVAPTSTTAATATIQVQDPNAGNNGLVAVDDTASEPFPLQIAVGQVSAISNTVSIPTGDATDSIAWTIDGGAGATLRFTIACAGSNFENARFTISQDSTGQSNTYRCGQVYETALNNGTETGSIEVQAAIAPSYVEWTITGTAFQ